MVVVKVISVTLFTCVFLKYKKQFILSFLLSGMLLYKVLRVIATFIVVVISPLFRNRESYEYEVVEAEIVDDDERASLYERIDRFCNRLILNMLDQETQKEVISFLKSFVRDSYDEEYVRGLQQSCMN